MKIVKCEAIRKKRKINIVIRKTKNCLLRREFVRVVLDRCDGKNFRIHLKLSLFKIIIHFDFTEESD